MTSYRFGDIVLVPFPFTDQTTSKKRPAVVVSAETYNQSHPDLIMMAITSQVQSAATPDSMNIADWQTAGLLKPSLVKPILATIEKNLVLKRLGRLGVEDRQMLQAVLQRVLGE
jgi:mRNA interferase MazF